MKFKDSTNIICKNSLTYEKNSLNVLPPPGPKPARCGAQPAHNASPANSKSGGRPPAWGRAEAQTKPPHDVNVRDVPKGTEPAMSQGPSLTLATGPHRTLAKCEPAPGLSDSGQAQKWEEGSMRPDVAHEQGKQGSSDSDSGSASGTRSASESSSEPTRHTASESGVPGKLQDGDHPVGLPSGTQSKQRDSVLTEQSKRDPNVPNLNHDSRRRSACTLTSQAQCDQQSLTNLASWIHERLSGFRWTANIGDDRDMTKLDPKGRNFDKGLYQYLAGITNDTRCGFKSIRVAHKAKPTHLCRIS